MSTLLYILIGIVLTVLALIILFKCYVTIKRFNKKRAETHRLSIQPSLSFYISKNESDPCLVLKNTGLGKAINIHMNDFFHPKEKAWQFIFQDIDSLDPDKEKKIEYTFFVGEQKAFNKSDLLWMFDPEHDHDFTAEINIQFSDIEKNTYRQKIAIGKDGHKPGSPVLIKKEKQFPG